MLISDVTLFDKPCAHLPVFPFHAGLYEMSHIPRRLALFLKTLDVVQAGSRKMTYKTKEAIHET